MGCDDGIRHGLAVNAGRRHRVGTGNTGSSQARWLLFFALRSRGAKRRGKERVTDAERQKEKEKENERREAAPIKKNQAPVSQRERLCLRPGDTDNKA